MKNTPSIGDIFQSNCDREIYEFISTHSIQEARDGNAFQYPAYLLKNSRTGEIISVGASQFDLFYQFVDRTLLSINNQYTNEDLIREFINFYNDSLESNYVKKLNDRVYYTKLSIVADRIVDNFENLRLHDHSKYINGVQKPSFHDNTRALLKDFALSLLLIIEISGKKSKK